MGESSFMTRYNYLFVLSKGNEIVVYDAGTDDQEIKLVKHASGTEVIGMLKSCQRTWLNLAIATIMKNWFSMLVR